MEKEYFVGAWEDVELEILEGGVWKPCEEYAGREDRRGFGDCGAVKIYFRGVFRYDATYSYFPEIQELQILWDDLCNISECYRVERIDDDEMWLYHRGDSRWPEEEECSRVKMRRVE